MSNALKNVAETTAHAWSDLVDEAKELVDEARDRLPDLPPLGRARRRNSRKRWLVMALIGAVLFAVATAGKRRKHVHHDTTESSPGARLTEKSLAVS